MANWEWVEANDRSSPAEVKLAGQGWELKVNPVGGFISTLKYQGIDVVVPFTGNNPKRSGIPRLGPIAGPVVGTAWEYLYPNMPQHGTDRIEPMAVMEKSPTGVILSRLEGPKGFSGVWRTDLRTEITEGAVMIAQTMINLEDKPRERAVAFHPYLANHGVIEIKGSEREYSPPQPGQAAFYPKVYEVIYETSPISGNPAKILAVKLDFSPTPTQVVRWTDNPGAYECWEPWWAALGRGWIFGPRQGVTFKMRVSAKIYTPRYHTPEV